MTTLTEEQKQNIVAHYMKLTTIHKELKDEWVKTLVEAVIMRTELEIYKINK